MKIITGALLLIFVKVIHTHSFKRTDAYKVKVQMWNDSIFEGQLTATREEPRWMKLQDPHPIEEHFSVYIQTASGHDYVSNNLEGNPVLPVVDGHNSFEHFPMEAEAKIGSANNYQIYEVNIRTSSFRPYDVNYPHRRSPHGAWFQAVEGLGRIYVAVEGTRLVYWAPFNKLLTDAEITANFFELNNKK